MQSDESKTAEFLGHSHHCQQTGLPQVSASELMGTKTSDQRSHMFHHVSFFPAHPIQRKPAARGPACRLLKKGSKDAGRKNGYLQNVDCKNGLQKMGNV